MILSTGLSVENAKRFYEALSERILSLQIPHAGSPDGILTISAGYAVQEYREGMLTTDLVARADKAPNLAKSLGRNRAAGEP